MDVFRRSAAARVIYRGTLALPPSPSRSVTKLFSLSLSFYLSLSVFLPRSVSLFSCCSLCRSRSFSRSDSVHEGGTEGDGGIPNERYDGISFPLSLFLLFTPSPLSLFLSSTLSRYLPFSLSLFTSLPPLLSFPPTRFCSQRHVVRPTH